MSILAAVSAILACLTAGPAPSGAARAPFSHQTVTHSDDLRRQLNSLTEGELSLAADAVRDRIKAGLEGDARVQEAALWALASRPVVLDALGKREKWALEKPLLEELRPKLLELVDSPSSDVRRGTLAALTALDAGQPGLTEGLSVDTTLLLTRRYGLDRDAAVRGEIVRLLALVSKQPEARPTLIGALSDTDPGIVQAAVWGVGEHGIVAELPRLVRFLKHEAVDVRVAAAGSISMFGAAARDYLPDLEAAALVETDAVARSTLQGTISLLKRELHPRP